MLKHLHSGFRLRSTESNRIGTAILLGSILGIGIQREGAGLLLYIVLLLTALIVAAAQQTLP